MTWTLNICFSAVVIGASVMKRVIMLIMLLVPKEWFASNDMDSRHYVHHGYHMCGGLLKMLRFFELQRNSHFVCVLSAIQQCERTIIQKRPALVNRKGDHTHVWPIVNNFASRITTHILTWPCAVKLRYKPWQPIISITTCIFLAVLVRNCPRNEMIRYRVLEREPCIR